MRVLSRPGRPAQGYFLQPYPRRPAGAPGHRLAPENGPPLSCALCHQAAVPLLQLDAADPRLELSPDTGARIILLACPSCEVTAYADTHDGQAAALSSPSPAKAGREPGWNVFRPPVPAAVLLHAIPERIATARELAAEGRLDEAGDWAHKFDWSHPTHQVGGRPRVWSRRLAAPLCLGCRGAMPFLAAIVEGSLLEEDGTPATEFLQPPPATQTLFFRCHGCRVVTALRDRPDEEREQG